MRSLLSRAYAALGIWDQPDPRYPVIVVDTSHWTGRFDWQLFKERGGTAGIIKCLDGKVLDPWFKENYRGAKDAGVSISVFQWLYGYRAVSPAGQGRALAALLKDYPVDFKPFVDFERYTPNVALSPVASDIESHVGAFSTDYGERPGVYTGYYYWRDFGPKSAIWADDPLWIARYKASAPLIPAPWKSWALWQWTESADGVYWGSAPDGERGIDLSYFNGADDEFRAYFNIGGGTLPPPTGGSMYQGIVIATAGLNIRAGAGSTFTDIGDLYYGDKVEASEKSGAWWKLTKINGVAVTRESWASEGPNKEYIQQTGETLPPVDTVTVDVAVDVNGTRYEAKNIPVPKV